MNKRLHPPLPQERWPQNCQELPTLISIAAKIYNALLLNCVKPEIEKILRKNQNGFWKKWSPTSQILTIRQTIGVCAKNLVVPLLFVDFSKPFDFIHRGKMEEILQAYGLLKETVTAIIMLYKNMNVKQMEIQTSLTLLLVFCSTLALYLFIICLDYILWMLIDLMKENGFPLKKPRSRWYPVETILDADYADDIVFLANTPTQAESLWPSLDWAASGFGLHVNADKWSKHVLIKKERSPL